MNHRVQKERVFSSKSSGKNPRKSHEDGISPHPPAELLKLPLQILSQQCQSLNEALEHQQPISKKLASRILNIPCSASMSASWYLPESLTNLKQQTGKNLLGCHSLKTII